MAVSRVSFVESIGNPNGLSADEFNSILRMSEDHNREELENLASLISDCYKVFHTDRFEHDGVVKTVMYLSNHEYEALKGVMQDALKNYTEKDENAT